MKSRLSLFVCFLTLLTVWGCRVQNNPPELISLTPQKAFVGEEISLSGYQFGSDPVVMVGSGSTALAATIKSNDENSIRAVVPLVPPGRTQVRVSTDQGTSDPLPFEVQQPAPALTSITPGNALPGDVVVLTGAFLNQLQRVRFNDINAVVRDSSAEKLTIQVPATAPRGPSTIYVETVGGTLSGSFIVAGTPQITAVSPKVTRPGAELTITGVNLTNAVIQINDQRMDPNRTVIKDTEIKTIIPEFAATGRIIITVFEKLVATSADTVKVVQPPFITNLPVRDGVVGDKIILTGRNFNDVSTVTFGSLPAQFRILSVSEIEAIVPKLPATGSVEVSVSGVGGTNKAGDLFFFYQIPSAITFTPTRQIRSRTITITGQNLYRITEVRINGQRVPITDGVEGVQLFVNVPADGTSGLVSVTNRGGTATAATPLVVVQKPLVTEITPAKAKLGDRIILKGDFLLNAQVFFNGTTVVPVEGGKNEDTERWVLVPNGAQTGPVRIVNIAGETLTSPFTVVRLITALDINPKTARVGETVTMTGQNLASATEVRFGNGTSAAAKFSLDADGQLLVTVPAGATTGTVCVTNEAGTTCTTAVFTVAR